MAKKFKTVKTKLPRGFVPVASAPGTTAFLYLNGTRDPNSLPDDPDLKWIINDKHPEGGLIYVFKDHSSVVWQPSVS